MLDAADILRYEQARQFYERSTAGAVQRYKTRRNIINYSYQTNLDDMIGHMTIRSLDTEMQACERGKLNLLIAFGVLSPPRDVVISGSQPAPAAWARQVADASTFLVLAQSHAIRPQGVVKDLISPDGRFGFHLPNQKQMFLTDSRFTQQPGNR
jgi:hypothetical protein